MENAKKIISILAFILFSCESSPDLKHLKWNLYTDNKGQVLMKFSNKNVQNPSQEKNWEDTVYRHLFYFEYDSIININDVVDIESYKPLVIDESYTDKQFFYINSYYQPGKRMYRIIKKDSLNN